MANSKQLARRGAAFERESKEHALHFLSAIAERMNFSQANGMTHNGSRDLYQAAGYPAKITASMYRDKYQRNGLVRRLTTLYPNATWRGGAELMENDDPKDITPFEESWLQLETRLHVWDTLRRGDILAQQGRYSVLLIGGPGRVDQELEKMNGPADVGFIKPYPEATVVVKDNDLIGYPFTGNQATNDPRYGLPKYYTFTRLGAGGAEMKVHWQRVIHLADDALEDPLYADPKLASVWNWILDVEKVVGSGAEAYWQLVVPMIAAKLAPGTIMGEGQEALVEAEVDKLIHGLRRWARTAGIDLQTVGTSSVEQFSDSLDALVGLIALSYGVPQRILLGSERGELASSQDAGTFDQSVRDRRQQFAETQATRPLIDRLVEHGALVPPTDPYFIRWPETRDMSMEERLKLAKIAAETNAAQTETVMTTNEIRDAILGLDALDEDEIAPVGRPQDIAAARVSLRAAKSRRRDKAVQFRVERDRAGLVTAVVPVTGGSNGSTSHA